MSGSVLITGAGTGIGLATALHLAERGYAVFASVPDLGQRAGIEEAAATRGVDVRVLLLDVTHRGTIESAVSTIMRDSGGIYGVVHCAGLGLRGFFEDLKDDEIRRLFDVNVFGVMAVTRAVLPHMRTARRGRIVIVSSAAGRIASMTISAYCAAKFALEGFGESVALETAPLGLHVSLIEPGLVMTPHFTVNRGRARTALDSNSPYYAWFAQHESMVDDILRQNRVTPADVAIAVRRALTARNPRLRYIVGWRAKLLISLRRHLPGQLFHRIYSRRLTRIVTSPREPATGLSDLSLPGV